MAKREGRATATFQPYFWEAYNEIVRPDRYDWYLVSKWLRELGPLGFALLKALRRACYHNPRTGVIRDQVEMDMVELAETVGVNKATVYRELERNETLKAFVRVQHQYVATAPGKAPKRCLPQFTVCMDDPIHPDDMERYDELRARKEVERAMPASGESKYRTKGTDRGLEPKSQSAIKGGSKSQIATPESQIATPESQSATNAPYKLFVPPVSLPSDSVPPQAAGDAPPIDSPQGEGRHGSDVEGEGSRGSAATAEDVAGELRDSLLCAAWAEALKVLAGAVNRPTFEAHLKPLRPLSLDEAAAGDDVAGLGAAEVVLLCPSAFTREWLDKRHRPAIEGALGAALGRPVAVRLTAAAAPPAATAAREAREAAP